MNDPLDSGPESQNGEGNLPDSAKELSTFSGTVEYFPQSREASIVPHNRDEDPQEASVEANGEDRTVISQRPVAAPEEFYRAMPLSELAAMLEGRQLDHFAVDQMIGGGGMGAVFRGRDLRLDRVVAIKVIPAAKRNPETLRRFRLEAQAAAKLDHPNIARVYYVGEAEQWNYIVFEFIDGVNIRDLVEMEGPLSVDDAVYYCRQVAEALQHAHERDVVHRDIKPSNVLVTASGAAKVVDMGLARNTALDTPTADATASGVTLGTFDYISPEQARNPRDADVRSDLYSLGCTLFFMLTGHPPFPEGTALQKLLSHGSQHPPDPRGWREDLSDQLYEITMKLMAKRPSDRYQKPSELISDLVMLAEVEDLPRSQSPGTFLVSSNIAQRSLVETNLPWMVAVAFLLGSTLWLQSVQTLSNDFIITELDFKTRENSTAASEAVPAPSTNGAAAAGQPVAPTPPLNNGTQLGDRLADPMEGIPKSPEVQSASFPQIDTIAPQDATSPFEQLPGSVLVVCSDRPTDVDSRLWESRLSRGIERASQSNVREIELRGRQILSGPVALQGRDLLIRGAANSGAAIELSEEMLSANSQAPGSFELQDSKLKFSSIAFDVMVPMELPIARQGLFSLHGSSQLEMENCTVSVHDLSEVNDYSVVLCNEQQGAAGRPTVRGATTSDTNLSGNSTLIWVDKSMIRGEASFISLNVTDETLDDRVDISLSDTLVAISGSVLKIEAPTGDTKAQRFARLLCDQSTFATQQPFATLAYVGESKPLLGLIRTSQNCIYWSRPIVPHIRIEGARRQSLLGNFNLLLLQGMNNLYDANIEDLCQSYLGGEKVATFGFAEAYTSGWLGERGNESRVRWRSPNVPPFPLHAASPQDFAVADILFAPGTTPHRQ